VLGPLLAGGGPSFRSSPCPETTSVRAGDVNISDSAARSVGAARTLDTPASSGGGRSCAWSVPLAVIALLCDGRPRPSTDQRPHPSGAQGGVSGASVAPPADSPRIRIRGARIFSPSAVPPHQKQKEVSMTEQTDPSPTPP